MIIVDMLFSVAIYFCCYFMFDEMLRELDSKNGTYRKPGIRMLMLAFWFITWPTMLIKEKINAP